MKIAWEAHDIIPGRRAGSPERSERWLIGYDGARRMAEPRYYLISLSDGMQIGPMDQQAIAARLNANGDWPIELLEKKK